MWLRDYMTYSSKLRYLFWRLRRTTIPVMVQLKTGEKLILRPEPADDLNIAYEVFAEQLYKLPEELQANKIGLIVDVGANVGYTCLFWLRNFPEARVIAFEPHPVHLEQLQYQLSINCAMNHVFVIPAAAGTKTGQLYLTDEGCRSTIVGDSGKGRIAISAVDLLGKLRDESIDLLKMDIEGGEFELLDDPRFAELSIKILVLEWHLTAEQPKAREWCIKRLKEMDYQVMPEEINRGPNGMLWARRMVGGSV